jgi:hypothetical protein
MNTYKCIPCNFETKRKNDYTRHVSTEKHKLLSIEKHKCDTCTYKTSNKYDYTKHLMTKKHLDNSQKTEKNNVEENNNITEVVKKELDIKTQELMREIQRLKELNNQNTNKLVKEARTIKKSILTLLNTHFKDTPSIEYIKQDSFITELEKEYKSKINDGTDKIFMLIFQDYEKKKLVKTLSDLILKFVKKDDQKFQSVFNVDASRANFATKIDDFWMNDKKGIQLRKFTIDKVIAYMIDVLDVFRLYLVNIRKENIVRGNVSRSDYLMKNQALLLEVVSFLTNSNTHTRIIMQLSPNLRCDEQLLHLCEF